MKIVENIVVKKEIACFEQFLLLSCFQKPSAADAFKCVYRWEKMKQKDLYSIINLHDILFIKKLLLYFHTITDLQYFATLLDPDQPVVYFC